MFYLQRCGSRHRYPCWRSGVRYRGRSYRAQCRQRCEISSQLCCQAVNREALTKCLYSVNKKISNLDYTRSITPKRVTSGGSISAALCLGNTETLQRWRAVGGGVRCDLPGNPNQTSRTDGDVWNPYAY